MDPESLSVTHLIARIAEAATAPDEASRHRAWRQCEALRAHTTREVFDAGVDWSRSPHVSLRLLAVDVLSGLALEGAFAPDVAERLTAMLADPDVDVLCRALEALTYLDDGDVEPICALAEHVETDVRVAVAGCLAGCEAPVAHRTLIAMSVDRDDAVRQAATAGLGSLMAFADAAIGQALVLRLADTDTATREEAMLGLALRRDERADTAIREALDEPEVSEIVSMAGLALEARRPPGASRAPWPPRH
jgi:HEAT repeat protein